MQFGPRLRRLRQDAGLSLRQLAAAAHVGKSTLSELENGVTGPSPEMAAHLDRVLSAGGRLAALAPVGAPDPEARERICHAVAAPARVDAAVVEALAGVLAAQRRADDLMPAEVLLPGTRAGLETVTGLARDARGPATPALHRVAAEWAQFTGWLMAEAGHDAQAVRMMRVAAHQAHRLGDGVLAAQVADFRGWLARQRGHHREAGRWCLTAAEQPGGNDLQRIVAYASAAISLAHVGDRAGAGLALRRAEALMVTTAPAPASAYWLSTVFLQLPIGAALLATGERSAAADQLSAGLGGLPDGWAESEWAAEYRAALEHASA